MKQQKLEDYSIVELKGDLALYQEIRYERDGAGLPVYIGYNREPNALTTDLSWFIVKNTIVAGAITRQQLPNLLSGGVQYKYAWDSRATYFT